MILQFQLVLAIFHKLFNKKFYIKVDKNFL